MGYSGLRSCSETTKALIPRLLSFGSGSRIRTYDLWVMSPTSYLCSIPHFNSALLKRTAKIYFVSLPTKFICNYFSKWTINQVL